MLTNIITKETSELSANIDQSRLTHWLLICGVIGPLLFIVVFLIEGATRVGYSVWRNYVSDLAMSDQGWQQIANFIVCGLLIGAYGLGLARVWTTGKASVWGPRLIVIFGLSLIVAGVFVTDPARGYPIGAPIKSDDHSWHGIVHGINGLLLFNLVLPAVNLVFARRFASEPENRRWATFSILAAVVILLLSVLDTVAGALDENGVISSPTGILQRIGIILEWGWVSLTALHLIRQQRQALRHT